MRKSNTPKMKFLHKISSENHAAHDCDAGFADQTDVDLNLAAKAGGYTNTCTRVARGS